MRYSSSTLTITTRNSVYTLEIGGFYNTLRCVSGTMDGRDFGGVADLDRFIPAWNLACASDVQGADVLVRDLIGKPFHVETTKTDAKGRPIWLTTSTVMGATWAPRRTPRSERLAVSADLMRAANARQAAYGEAQNAKMKALHEARRALKAAERAFIESV